MDAVTGLAVGVQSTGGVSVSRHYNMYHILILIWLKLG